VKLKVGQPVSVVDEMGVIRRGYRVVTSQDHQGQVMVTSGGGIKKVHISRIRMPDADGSLAVATDTHNQHAATCPNCRAVCVVTPNATEARCGKCGRTFKIAEHITTTPQPASQSTNTESKSPTKEPEAPRTNEVNLDELARDGEVLIKRDINFSPGIDAMAVVYRYGERYVCFNLYNGSIGRRGKVPPFEKVKAGEAGYAVKDETKWRERFIKRGYKPYASEETGNGETSC